MFGLFSKKRKTVPFDKVAADLARLVGVHVSERFKQARIPIGVGPPNGPFLVDVYSRTDVYLLGYVTGWCETLEKFSPDINSREKYIQFNFIVFIGLFGTEHAEDVLKLVVESIRDPEFERGVLDGHTVASPFVTQPDNLDVPNLLLPHLLNRR